MRIFRRMLRRVSLTRRPVVVGGVSVCLAVSAGLLVPGPVSATPLANDYPAYLRAKPRDALVDPWYFYSRECTSFVAWRLTNDNKIPFTNNWGGAHFGNAYEWAAAAKRLGFAVNSTPSVGSVAWWNQGSSGSRFGHVAWVAQTYSDGSILIEEYNYVSAGNYSQRHLYPGTRNWPSGFLHLGDLALASTAAPVISGTAAIGSALKASTGSWTQASKATFAYTWLANGSAIPGATTASFVPTLTQLGQKLTVKVTATAGKVTKSSTSTSTAAIVPGTFTLSKKPALTGVAQVGTPLTASTGTWSPAGDYTFQWFDGTTAIPGATAASFTPTAAQLGKKLTATITATGSGYNTKSVATTATASVLPGVFKAAALGSLPKPAVGTPLTATPGTITGTATPNLTYLWKANSAPIKGATGPTYTPTASDLAKTLTVTITAAAPGYTTLTRVTPASAPVQLGTFKVVEEPSLPDVARYGVPFIYTPTTWSATPTKVTYQWLLNGRAIGNVPAPRYTPTMHTIGSRLSLIETVSSPGYRTAQIRTDASSIVMGGTGSLSSSPTITGTRLVGRVLTLHASTAFPTDAARTPQWLRDGEPIKGATRWTYTLTTADLTHRIAAQVSVSRSLWTTGTYSTIVSNPIEAPGSMTATVKRVAGGKATVTVTITGPGVAKPGGVITVRNGSKVLGTRTVSAGKATFTIVLASTIRTVDIAYSDEPLIRPFTKTGVPVG